MSVPVIGETYYVRSVGRKGTVTKLAARSYAEVVYGDGSTQQVHFRSLGETWEERKDRLAAQKVLSRQRNDNDHVLTVLAEQLVRLLGGEAAGVDLAFTQPSHTGKDGSMQLEISEDAARRLINELSPADTDSVDLLLGETA